MTVVVNSSEPLYGVPVVYIDNHLVVATFVDSNNMSALAVYAMQSGDLPNPGPISFNASAFDPSGNSASLFAVTSGSAVIFGIFVCLFVFFYDLTFLLRFSSSPVQMRMCLMSPLGFIPTIL